MKSISSTLRRIRYKKTLKYLTGCNSFISTAHTCGHCGSTFAKDYHKVIFYNYENKEEHIRFCDICIFFFDKELQKLKDY